MEKEESSRVTDSRAMGPVDQGALLGSRVKV